MPAALSYLWRWFNEIAMGLAANGMSIPVVTWEALVSWSLMRDVALERWESLALVRLGQIRASVLSQKQNQTPTPPGRNN
ncbi:MAG: hypothetical protein Q8M26_08710 [Pseudolabrys sp.]|nr:hypothetical protein [Pseudolabrys sp.]